MADQNQSPNVWEGFEAPSAPATSGAPAATAPAANVWSGFEAPAQAQETPAPAPAAAPAASIWSSFESTPAAKEPVSTPTSSSIWSNFDQTSKYGNDTATHGLSEDERKYASKSPEEMEDEPWYSKAWEWANSPLYDLHKWGTREGAGTFERGLETGLEDIGSGFTSPLMIGLTLATLGGSAAEEAGVGALRAIGISKYAAPIVASSARALMTAGFDAQMIGGLVTQSPQFLDALKDGDVEEATRLGTNILATTAFLAKGASEFKEAKASVKSYLKGKDLTTTQRLGLFSELEGIHSEDVQKGDDAARVRSEEIVRQLKAGGGDDPVREAGIRHWLTQDLDAEDETVRRLKAMKGIAEGTLKPKELSPAEQEAVSKGWNNELVYVAVDKKNLDIIKNAGIKKDTEYHNTPEDALKNATLPDSGNKKDLVVLSVPRREVEGSTTIRETPQLPALTSPTIMKRAAEVAPYDDYAEERGLVNETVGTNKDKYEPHIAIPEKLAKVAKITSDQEIHAHELAHSIWASLRGLALGDIHSHLSIDSEPQNFIAAAEIGLERFQHRDGSWAPEKIKPEQVEGLVDSFMAGKAADEIISGIPSKKNVGAWGDIDNVHELLKAMGVKSTNDRWQMIHASLERVKGEMQKYGIDNIIKDEFNKGREQGLSPQLHYSRQRLLGIADRVKDAINEKDNNAVKASGEGTVKGRAFRKATEGEQGPSDEDLRSEKLKSRTSHMPIHQLVMDTDTPTGEYPKVTKEAIPLRPFGAEDMPGDNSRFQNNLTQKEKTRYLAGLDYAINKMTPEDHEIAKTLRQLYDNSFEKAHDAGLIRQWVEAYHPQAWADQKTSIWKKIFDKDYQPVENEALNQLRHDTNAGNFDTNINAAKQRAYSTEFQGVMAGQIFKSDDLAMHAYNHMRAIDNAIAGRKYLTGLMDNHGYRGADGRPAVAMHGTTRIIGGDQNPAMAITPANARTIHIPQEVAEKMNEGINPKTNKTDLQNGLDNGTIIKLPWTVENSKGEAVPAYAYSTEGYVSIDSHHMKNWGYVGKDTAGNPAFMHAEVKVHPDFAKQVRMTLGAEESLLRENPTLRAVGAASGEAKGLLLSISPFHLIQEGMRAALVGIAPWNWTRVNVNDSPTLSLMSRYGLKLDGDAMKDKFSTGYASHSKLISMIPGLNRFQNAMQSFLFDKYIPGLKSRAALKVFEDLRDANPHLTKEEVAGRAADIVNDTFGGQNWHKLGVTTAQQDFMRMTALAPDWLISEARMGARALGLMDKETGAYARKQMAKQVAAVWVGARVLNMLTSGQMHNEAPFGIVRKNDKGEETVFSVRMLPTDIIHMLSDPEQFLRGRVNPLVVKPALEAATGRDEMGRRASFEQQMLDTARGIVPIASQGLFKASSYSTPEQIAKAAGASVYKYRTEAEKLAQQYASDRMPSGPVDQQELAQHQKEIRLEDAYRAGQINRADLNAQLPKRRVTDVIRRQGMNALQARFDRLPMSEKINVWDAATKAEKDLLHAQLWKARQAWLKQHKPAERENEPVWRKMQSTFGDLR